MNQHKSKAGMVVALGVALSAAPAAAAPVLRHTVDQPGDFVLFGNTLAFDCDPNVPKPVVGTATCAGNDNPSAPEMFWRSDDPAAGQATSNRSITPAGARSTAVLALPAGAEITYARIYWGGVRSGAANDTAVTIERPGAFTQAITADGSADAKYADLANVHYQSTADVTALLRAHGTGAYRVSGVDSVVLMGRNDHRVYAGWSMVVFYKLAGQPQRNLTLFDGLDLVEAGAPATAVTLNGFLVPLAGFDAKLGVIAYEGDDLWDGDSLAVNGVKLQGPDNPVNNFFNGTRTWLGTPVSNVGDLPQLLGSRASLNGMDLDVVDIKPLVKQGDTSARLEASTTSENYLLGGFVTSIATFKPDFTATNKTFTNLTTRPGGGVRPGDVIEYTIATTNTGNDVGTSVTLVDEVPAGLTYVAGSLQVAAGANAGPKTDAAGDDQGEYNAATRTVTVRLGTGATASAAGQLAIGATTTVVFRATVDASAAGTIANQAVLTAAGLAGAPSQTYKSDGNGAEAGPQATSFPVDECESATDCPASKPICAPRGPNGRLCVACASNTDCPVPRPVCDAVAHVCGLAPDGGVGPGTPDSGAGPGPADGGVGNADGGVADGGAGPGSKDAGAVDGGSKDGGLDTAKVDAAGDGGDRGDPLTPSAVDARASGDGAQGSVDGGAGDEIIRVSGGGCQCNTGGSGAGLTGAWWLIPLALVARGRRRRRSR